MPRRPRIEIPGGYYHVGARGNDRQQIFDDAVRALFLLVLADVASAYEWSILAYAMMTNHYHLVIQLEAGGLSDGMRDLNNRIARASNARFARINHAFGQRFWDRHLKTEQHLRASIPYVLWNPARRGVGSHPRDSTWTSYRASIGLEHPPKCLAVRHLHELYGPNPIAAIEAFERHVSDGRGRCQAP